MRQEQFYLRKIQHRLKIQSTWKKNVFIIYSPRHIKIEPASFRRIDTEILVFLPNNSIGFITSRFNDDELKEVLDGEHRFWIEILNRSFEDNIVIKKKNSSSFLVVEPENLKFKYVLTKKEQSKREGVLLDIRE